MSSVVNYVKNKWCTQRFILKLCEAALCEAALCEAALQNTAATAALLGVVWSIYLVIMTVDPEAA